MCRAVIGPPFWQFLCHHDRYLTAINATSINRGENLGFPFTYKFSLNSPARRFPAINKNSDNLLFFICFFSDLLTTMSQASDNKGKGVRKEWGIKETPIKWSEEKYEEFIVKAGIKPEWLPEFPA